MKRIIATIVCLLFVVPAWALYYGVSYTIDCDNLGGVVIHTGDTPFPQGAIVGGAADVRQTIVGKYLKVVNGRIIEKAVAEKAFVDLANKYKKQVGGVWVEMSAEEKHLVDLPEKYKKPDGSEMTPEEKAAVDAALEVARQAAKPVMLKQIENMYVTYLTNDWTILLRSKGIIETNFTVNVTNTTETVNMTYLMMLRVIDKDNYLKYVTEFKVFDDTVRDKFGSSTGDAVWHE